MKKKKWSPELVVQIKKGITKEIQRLALEQKALNAAEINRDYPLLYWKARFYFGGWDRALKVAGLDPRQIRLRKKFKKWNKDRVIREIQKLYYKGRPCHVTYIQKHHGQLWGAIQRYFGSYQRAIEEAGLNYSQIRKQEKRSWDKETVLSEIKMLKEKGISLKEEFIKSTYPNLRYAARRFFGLWRKAVEAAGFNYEQFLEKKWRSHRWIEKLSEEEINQIGGQIEKLEIPTEKRLALFPSAKKKKMSKVIEKKKSLLPCQQRVLDEIKELKDLDKPLNAVYVQTHNKSLYHRACTYFKSWKRAVIAAGINYSLVQKRGWSPETWINSLSERDLKNLERQLISINRKGR